MKKVLVPLVEGFEDIEAVSIIDVLRRGGCEVVTAAVSDAPFVMSAHGVTMDADRSLSEAVNDDYDAIVLPGGPGTDGLLGSASLIGRLGRQRREGKLIAAICAAPTVLTRAGIVEPGVKLTCYPSCAVNLDRPCEGVPVVVDGTLITGQAPGSAIPFALAVLAALAGQATSDRVASGMVVVK